MASAITAMMQPTYLPWIGYFDLMDQSDYFVILDDLQFSKQSWQQRNRIRTANDADWLSVPVEQKMGQLISNTKIYQPDIVIKKHLKSLELNYSRAGNFKDYFSSFKQIFAENSFTHSLSSLNITIIRWIAEQLSIETQIILSSELKSEGVRSAKLVNICKHLACNQYLSTPGAKEYLQEDKQIFTDGGIDVFLHGYEHPVWKQVFDPFIPYCSAIDLIFNHGKDSRMIMLSGRTSPKRLE